ncbi:hypothetical protein ABZ328_29270 [Micromonospora aurantiaca]|uniref:hypothetical protein n=1 Tax=Micromonospora aurantiaca (nom. illeg.) TaxID=47850 RepID=UPI00340A62E9
MEVTGGRRLLIRQGSAVVFLARVDAACYDVDYRRLRGFKPVLPPVWSTDAGRMGGNPAKDRNARWAYRFADLLTTSKVSPLYPSRWLLQPGAPHLRFVEAFKSISQPAPTAERWSELLVDEDAGQLDWYIHGGSGLVLAMRPMSRPDDARVKSYRKQVRSRTLPPILLWWVSSLDSYLLLDGHDRLAACMAEEVEPPLMTLTAVVDADEVHRCHTLAVRRHAKTQAHIEGEIAKGTPGATDALIAERQRFADELTAPQLRAKPGRAWTLAGGAHEWNRLAVMADPVWTECHR